MADDIDDLLPLPKEEFARLLNERLPLNATDTQLREHIRGRDQLINQLFRIIAQQGAAILDIREKMVEHKNAIEAVADMASDVEPAPGLVGFEEPSIIMPRKN